MVVCMGWRKDINIFCLRFVIKFSYILTWLFLSLLWIMNHWILLFLLVSTVEYTANISVSGKWIYPSPGLSTYRFFFIRFSSSVYSFLSSQWEFPNWRAWCHHQETMIERDLVNALMKKLQLIRAKYFLLWFHYRFYL